MATVSTDEVLLLWRAVRTFRSGRKPGCAPHGKPLRSDCPLYVGCARWAGPDDFLLGLAESAEETERRRAGWPCSRVLELLSPDVTRIGR